MKSTPRLAVMSRGNAGVALHAATQPHRIVGHRGDEAAMCETT